MAGLSRVCVCLLCFVSGAFAAQTLDPQELAALVRQEGIRIETLNCGFTQTIATPMFAAPLRSTGRFVFRAPDSLRWEYLKPLEQGFILAGGRVVRWENGKDARSVAPSGQDPLGAFLGRQMLAWVGADTETIGREYEVTLIGRDPLELSLAPRSAAAREVVKELRLIFSGRGVASGVRLTEAGGGSASLDFFDVRINEPLDPAEFE